MVGLCFPMLEVSTRTILPNGKFLRMLYKGGRNLIETKKLVMKEIVNFFWMTMENRGVFYG